MGQRAGGGMEESGWLVSPTQVTNLNLGARTGRHGQLASHSANIQDRGLMDSGALAGRVGSKRRVGGKRSVT